MPYKTEKQRRFMHAKHPQIARRWDAEEKKVTKLAPVIKSDDPEFNHEAAQQAAELVMKMDPDTAEMFTYFVMAEILEDDIEKNQRTLQRHLDHVVAKRIEKVKKALLSTVAKSGDESALAYAEAFAEVEKAWQNPYQTGAYSFDESDFRRDPRTGRFAVKVNVSTRKPMKEKQAKNLGIKVGNKDYTNLTPAQQAQYQQEYMQIANFLNVVSQAGDLGDHDALLRVENKHSHQMHWVPLAGKPKAGPDGHWDPAEERVVAVEARPIGLTLGGAAYNLIGGLSASTVGTINRADKKFGDFANDWTNPVSDPYNTNQRLYSRVATGARFVRDVAPDHALKVQTAARFGRAIGEHGPQAEKILGPTARKTAYRYRGVEKQPDAQVLRDYEIAIGRADRPVLSEDQRKRLLARQNRAVTNYRKNKATNQGVPEDAIRISSAERAQVRSDIERKFMEQAQAQPAPEARQAALTVLRDHLVDRDRAPDRDRYRLQLESGGTPPSEGFLLDKNGNIVTQAIGYGDDHYLPFNLRHLKKLRGGEYIRTRSVGGPTSEDIYTGLMAGAHRVTVLSRSGTFTITFADDFKGKRRYNDKARRMTRRYEKLLDTVQAEVVDRPVRIPPNVLRRIHQEVERDWSGLGPRDKRNKTKDLIDEYKTQLSAGRDEFRMFAEDQAQTLPDENERRVFIGQMMNDWDAHTETKFRLNGIGYEDALKALEEQFPYYIKVTADPTKELERVEPELDLGYVEPGRNRPTQANAGWRGTSRNEGTGFISASQTNYQRGRYHAASDRPSSNKIGLPERTQAQPAQTAPETPNGKLTPVEPGLSEEKVKEVEAAAQTGFQSAAKNLVKALQEHTNVKQSAINQLPVLGMSNDAEIESFFKDKNRVREADEFFASASDLLVNPETAQPLRDAYQEYKKASGQLGRVNYDPKLAFTRSGAPFLFPGQAYESGADPSLVENEARRISERTSPLSVSGMTLAEMSDNDLNSEIDIVDKVNRALGQVKDLGPDEKLKALRELGVDTSIPGVAQVLEGERIGRHAKDVQRMRALNLNRGDRSRGPNGTKVLTMPPRTPEEVSATKAGATNLARQLEEAAGKLEQSPDDRRQRAGGALRTMAAEFKGRSRQTEIDRGDYNALFDTAKPHVDLAGKVNYGAVEESDIENFLRQFDDE